MNPRITELLAKHRQLDLQKTCSASAHEFVAKLHGKLGDNEFPLQCKPAVANLAGFQFESFLNGIGFTGRPGRVRLANAIALLEAEVSNGRYPLVSLACRDSAGNLHFHIVVAVPANGGVGLVDPGLQEVIANCSSQSLRKLEETEKERPVIDILTYSSWAPPTS